MKLSETTLAAWGRRFPSGDRVAGSAAPATARSFREPETRQQSGQQADTQDWDASSVTSGPGASWE